MLVTQIVSAMTVMICMLIDSIMIGRFLGVDAMAAYGLSMPLLLVFAAFGTVLSAGIQVMCGKSLGCGDAEGTNAVFSCSVFMTTLISAVGLIAVLLLSGPLSTLLGAGQPGPDNPVFDLTQDYLRGFIIGAPAFLFAQIMVPYMQISGSQTRLVVAVAAMTVTDVALDVLNVHVFHGGMFGMGLASSLSYYVAFFIGVVYFFQKKCIFRFRMALVKLRRCLELLGYGIPTFINQVCLVLLVFVMNKILLRVGKNLAVAAYSVVSTVGNLCYCVSSGIGAVALMLSSIFYSDEDKPALHQLIRSMTRWAVVLNVAVTAAVVLAAPFLVGLFLTDNLEARELAILGVRLFSLSLLPSTLNTAFKNYYQGVGRLRMTEAISVMQSFALPVLSALLLSSLFSTTGVWLAWLSGELLTFLISSIFAWRKTRKVGFAPAAYDMLPPEFGAGEGESIELPFASVEDAVTASQKAAAFCEEHGEPARVCTLIALCIEEMAVNIVEHGFTKSKKPRQGEVRLLFKNGKRVLRLRDDCATFDPLAYLELHKADDPTSHIGIRMVMKMVKSANYVNSLGLNNLTLEL